MKRKILIVDDEKSMRDYLKILFKREGYEVEDAENGEEALRMCQEKNYDVVVSDIRMPKLSGIELLRELKKMVYPPEVILMTAYASVEDAVEALKVGALDYLIKPFDNSEMLHRVRNAIEKRVLYEENIELKQWVDKKEGFCGIIGKSPKMVEIFNLVQRISKTNSNVLIEGESGTGKELIARAIHLNSLRKNRPFVSINCGGIPETLLESELFGYSKGAFTGAFTSKKGLFDVAEGGTLFLDEIGEMPPMMQIKLLRAIQERTIRPVGSTMEHSVDVRLITATNKDLYQLVEQGLFREDLYYRINVIKIKIPPLRERKEDIPLLVNFFVQKYSDILNKKPPKIKEEFMKLLENYEWKGNVRELENVIERAIALEQEGILVPELLPEYISKQEEEELLLENIINLKKKFKEGFSFKEMVESFEILILKRALEMENYDLIKTAERLNISYRSLRYLVFQKYRKSFQNLKELSK